MNKYRNLVFDIGGVLLGYRWLDVLTEYGLSDEEASRIGQLIFNDSLWDDLDRGIIDYDSVIEEYGKKYPEDKEYTDQFLNNIGRISINRPGTWERIEKLKEMGYKIYLLSNYSQKLLDWHRKDMELFNHVDGKVVSYQVNYIKPEPEIYNALFSKYDLKPSESLFFDDRLENCEGSESQGMRAIKVESEAQLNEVLDSLLEGAEI